MGDDDPVPQGVKGPQRDPADVPRYNEAARRVMDAAGVRINDLYAFSQPRVARIQIPQNVHFTPAGSAELARPVAREIREALSQRRRAGSRGVRSTASPNRNEFAAREKWVKTHLDAHGDRPPFSFEFEGRPSTEFLRKWPVQLTSRKLDKARTERTLAWTDPRSGLVVRCVAVEYADYPVVEWTVLLQEHGHERHADFGEHPGTGHVVRARRKK